MIISHPQDTTNIPSDSTYTTTKEPPTSAMPDPIDTLIHGFDRSLRTLTGNYSSNRPRPGEHLEDGHMDVEEQAHAAGLMRVNHCGEICAQALYEGQALSAKSDTAKQALLNAADEELDHLQWCQERLNELQAKPSVFAPLFYASAWLMGVTTGLAGDKLSLGFVEATEDQVVQHLDKHLSQLPNQDHRSRAILNEMRKDEAKHAAQALQGGGLKFPVPIKRAMTLLSRLMTDSTYRA